MPNERSINLDVGVASENSFSAQDNPPGNADSRNQQQLADQGQDFRDLLNQQRKRDATDKNTSRLFELFQPLPTAFSQDLTDCEAAEPANTLEQAQQAQQVDAAPEERRDAETQQFDEPPPDKSIDLATDKTPATASAFALLQSLPTAASFVAPVQPPAALEQTLNLIVKQLLVNDGRHGRRAVQLQLAEEHQPGVVVDIFEESARLVTRFTCSNEKSREQLNAGATWLADSLAQRLHRDIRVEVQTNDPEDPRLKQADANS